MAVRRFVVNITTDGSGDATVYSPKLYGHLISLRYVKTDFTDGVDFTTTLETTGETIWTESDVNTAVTRYPRAASHSTAGAASLYASGGTAVNSRIAIGGDRVKIVIAQGGAAKVGAVHITIDG